MLLSEQGFLPGLQAAYAQVRNPPLTALFDAAPGSAQSFADWLQAEPDGPAALRIDPASACALTYTSGTTGFPKGVLVSHAADYRMYIATAIDTGLSHEDVFLMAVPMFHMAGMNRMLDQALFLGACRIIHRGAFDREAVLTLIATHRVTMAVLIPTIIGMMAQHPRCAQHDLSSLRMAFYGSMPMPSAILRAALSAFPAVRFNQLYGSTESGMLLVLPWADHAAHPHATGREALMSQVRVVDAGGRDVEVGQIGEVLAEHPAVREVAVLGLSDPIYGQSVCAALSFRPGHSATEAALDTFCRERLAGYKRPRRYAFYDARPRNASDKVPNSALLLARAG